MLGLGWASLLKGLAALVCFLGVVSLALTYFFPAPPLAISMASGGRYPTSLSPPVIRKYLPATTSIWRFTTPKAALKI